MRCESLWLSSSFSRWFTIGTQITTMASSRMAWFGTPTALSSDSSTWGGSVSNKYKVQISFTPQMKGAFKARLFLAKASTTVYVDPLLDIS